MNTEVIPMVTLFVGILVGFLWGVHQGHKENQYKIDLVNAERTINRLCYDNHELREKLEELKEKGDSNE